MAVFRLLVNISHTENDTTAISFNDPRLPDSVGRIYADIKPTENIQAEKIELSCNLAYGKVRR